MKKKVDKNKKNKEKQRMEVVKKERIYELKMLFGGKRAHYRPLSVTKKFYKDCPHEIVLVPNTRGKHVYADLTAVPWSATSVQFVEWNWDECSGDFELIPLNVWRVSELIKRFPIVYFLERTTKQIRKMLNAPTDRKEFMLQSRNFDKLKSRDDIDLASYENPHTCLRYPAEKEVLDDMSAQSFSIRNEFMTQIPLKFVYEKEEGDNAEVIEEDRADPKNGLTSAEVCDLIQPEFRGTPAMPLMRSGPAKIEFFYNEKRKNEAGNVIRDSKGVPEVMKKAKPIAEEFVYKHGIPLYAFDFNEKGGKSYFAATDEVIMEMYENRNRFAYKHWRFRKDPKQAECVNEMLMWRWGAKLYADIEAYYEKNPQIVGEEDERTWKTIDFLNEMLKVICNIEGVTRDSWTILEADKKIEDAEGKITGKVSRHALCQDPRVFFRTMLDEQVFYDVARDILQDRIDEGGEWIALEMFDQHGENALFWDTSVATFFRCFRMLGSDKYGAGRPLKYHTGCKPEGVPLPLACLIQRPIDGDLSEEAMKKFITFDMSGRKTVGVVQFEYDEANNFVNVSRVTNGKRKRVANVSAKQRCPDGQSASTVSPETRDRFIKWLKTWEPAQMWDQNRVEKEAIVKPLGRGFLIDLPRVGCYCYKLAQKEGREVAIHNGGKVFLIVMQNKNKTGCYVSQKCWSGKCPRDQAHYFGSLPREDFAYLFEGK